MGFAVLGGGTEADAVGEDGAEAVEVVADDVGVLVGDKSGEVLADALAHDAGFAVVDVEALLVKDGGGVPGEALGGGLEARIAGEGEIVGIAGVLCSGGFG